jgi:hypothetical protein
MPSIQKVKDYVIVWELVVPPYRITSLGQYVKKIYS